MPANAVQARGGDRTDAGVAGVLLPRSRYDRHAAFRLADLRYIASPVDAPFPFLDGISQGINQLIVSAVDFLVHLVVTIAGSIFRRADESGSVPNGFAEVRAIHQVSAQEALGAEPQLPDFRPPIRPVEFLFLTGVHIAGGALESFESGVLRRRKGKSAGRVELRGLAFFHECKGIAMGHPG